LIIYRRASVDSRAPSIKRENTESDKSDWLAPPFSSGPNCHSTFAWRSPGSPPLRKSQRASLADRVALPRRHKLWLDLRWGLLSSLLSRATQATSRDCWSSNISARPRRTVYLPASLFVFYPNTVIPVHSLSSRLAREISSGCLEEDM